MIGTGATSPNTKAGTFTKSTSAASAPARRNEPLKFATRSAARRTEDGAIAENFYPE